MGYEWILYVILAGIGFALVMGVTNAVTSHRQKIAEINAGGVPSAEVLEKLDAIEQRLARIEQALDEVPS
jgi:hypothetical protein